ncbi:MAG TPA: NAD(P)/FAD-dependent oxidoreductase [Tepidisphaeraceae bacterium]|jgi:flavin-dependent dehydrogenase
MNEKSCDVLVIGGGPAGATAAYLLAKNGIKVTLLEKSRFPRFHIGESILPQAFPLIQEIGLERAFRKIPHVPKLGAEFGMGDDPKTTLFTFQSALILGSWTFNVERSVFDKMLLDEARNAGADVRENRTVKQINRLGDGDCALTLDGGTILTSRYVLDASGDGCVVGRHLGIRKPIRDRNLQKVAYFAHFENVQRLPGDQEGSPAIIISDEGWFWLIPINEKITSVGFVCHPDFHKSIRVAPHQLLNWAILRCPVVRQRMKNATGETDNKILADFSYTCKPYAGAGYFLLGDAGCFLDPIFSTGVTLAMKSAQCAATLMQKILAQNISPARARRQYIRFVEGSTSIFWHLIKNYYKHSFRELFLDGEGPLDVHGAVISILAGHVFPKTAWKLRWRLWLFNLCMWTNQVVPMVRRRKRFSLVEHGKIEESPLEAIAIEKAHG